MAEALYELMGSHEPEGVDTQKNAARVALDGG